MPLNSQAGYSEPENSYDQELTHLYNRLATVKNLIRTLEEYDLLRPRPSQVPIREKTA